MLKWRPLGVVVNGKEVGEVLPFISSAMGQIRLLSEDGNTGDAVKCLFVLVKDVSGYTWLEPATACNPTVTVETPLRWCAIKGIYHMFETQLFQQYVLRLVAETLKMTHLFAVACSPWTNGMV